MTRHALPLLALAFAAGTAAAQPADSIAGALENQPLILFSHQDPPRDHDQATVIAQTARQVALLRGLLQHEAPSDGQRELGRRLRQSLFSVARWVLNNESPSKSPELARALMPYASADMAKALKDRGTALFGLESSPLGEISYMYDTCRAISHNLRGADGTLDRALALEYLRGALGAVPYVESRTERQFIVQLHLHGLVLELHPSLPASAGHVFKGRKVTQVGGEVGSWINGLANALTLGGRKANTDRLVPRIAQQ